MKKIVTALMIVLPLVFLIALFAVTNVASVTADISASSIRIGNKGDNGIFSFDIANYEHPMYESDLAVEVLPYKAKNRSYTLTVTDAHTGEASDIVSLNDDGSFRLNDVGVAKLTYTSNDGGYSDSVVFNVGSSGILEYTPILSDAQGNFISLDKGSDGGYTAVVNTGTFILGGDYYPQSATNVQIKYESENPSALTVNEVTGRVYAYFDTDTSVNMHVVNAFGQTVTSRIDFKVRKDGDASVNGEIAPKNSNGAVPTIVAPLYSMNFTLYVDYDGVTDGNITITGIQGATYAVRKLDEVNDHAYAVDVTLESPFYSPTSNIRCSIKAGDDTESVRHFKLAFANASFSVTSFGNPDGKDELVLLEGATTKFTVFVEPYTSMQYEWSVADENIAQIVSQNNEYCYIKATGIGRTSLRITLSYEKDGYTILAGTVDREFVVTKAYTSLMFNESVTKYGLGTLAIANQRYEKDDTTKYVDYTTALYNNVIGGDKAQVAVTDFNDVILKSSNKSIARVTEQNGKVLFIVKDTGDVTITASWKYGERFNVSPASITFKAVDGVYVSNYDELVLAGKQNKQIVLENDIYLGEKLFDDNGKAKYDDATMSAKLREYTKEIYSTADCRYYENTGKGRQTVRYCYEFANNVYGNGYALNTEYITNVVDSTGVLHDYAVFKGPLDFVAAYMNGTKIASVKGQDNISFLVRKDGIVLDNVVLAGCDDESLYDGDTMELNLLNYLGTTLEIMSDATIKNCRVKNGRTCVRIFGRDNVTSESPDVAQEKINVTIDGCRLQTAREFILKIGTNRFLQGTTGNLSPAFMNSAGAEYTQNNSTACDNLAKDDFFVSNYVLTDVVLKDSVLTKSGLFTIGMESHFAGEFLNSGADVLKGSLDGWSGLAATSYPAILHLVGDVVLEDWKDLEQVDSSTLIETSLNSDTQRFAFLSLNIKEMLLEVRRQKSECANIIKTVGDKNYVHGGIAFYGGGKNYHILDTSAYTFEAMRQYNVNISVLAQSSDDKLKMQGESLPSAAGVEDFRFVMFDATSNYSPK